MGLYYIYLRLGEAKLIFKVEDLHRFRIHSRYHLLSVEDQPGDEDTWGHKLRLLKSISTIYAFIKRGEAIEEEREREREEELRKITTRNSNLLQNYTE